MEGYAKKIYEKMADYKRFASILLAVGVFFYLGVITPTAVKSQMDLNMMMLASMSFLAASILFFSKSRSLKQKLLELEEENETF